MNNLPIGHRVGLAGGQRPLARFLGEALIDDIGAAEGRLEQGPEARFLERFPAQMKAMPPLAEFARHIAEGRQRIAVAHVVGIAARREMHADAARAEHLDHRVRHLEHQPGAVLDRAAIGVGAMVRAVLQELVEKIAVRAVDLDAVEARGLGVLGALSERLDDARDFLGLERARHDEGLLRAAS